MPASNYLEKALLEGSLNKVNYTAPLKVFLGLTEAPILKTYTGTEMTSTYDLTYEGYARVEITPLEWELSAGSGESTASKYVNKNAVTLKLNTNTTGKSVAKYFFLADAITNGNVLYFGKLTEELSIVKAITKLEIEAKKLEISAE